MLTLRLNATQHIAGFGVVKALLADQDLSTWPTAALLGLRLIEPDNPAAVAAIDEASLTDAAQAHDQIRFFLRDRLTRNLRDVAAAWAKTNSPALLTVGNGSQLDEGSLQFLRVLAEQHPDVTVQVLPGGLPLAGGREYLPTPAEQALQAACLAAGPAESANLDSLVVAARKYLSVGDAWTALSILNAVIRHRNSAVTWSCLGLAYAMLGRTFEAEFCYLRWRNFPEGPEGHSRITHLQCSTLATIPNMFDHLTKQQNTLKTAPGTWLHSTCHKTRT